MGNSGENIHVNMWAEKFNIPQGPASACDMLLGANPIL